jgi:hypothetical protein
MRSKKEREREREREHVVRNFFSPYSDRREIGSPLRLDCRPGDTRSAI